MIHYSLLLEVSLICSSINIADGQEHDEIIIVLKDKKELDTKAIKATRIQ